MSATGSGLRAASQRAIPEDRRLTYALLLSLLIHAWLLSLIFGGQGLWLPGFGFPWQDRRIEAPDLRVLVVPAQVTDAEPAAPPVGEPMPQAGIEQPVPSVPLPPQSPPRALTRRTTAAIRPEANPTAEANSGTEATATEPPAQTGLSADRPDETAPPPAPAVIAAAPTDAAPQVVPPVTPTVPTPVVTAAPSTSSPDTTSATREDAGDQTRALFEQQARERAVELAKLDALKQEERRQAEQREAAGQDAARQESARAETARLETERLEAARADAARVQAARVEAARVEAARAEATPAETARAEAARAEAARAEAARAEAARAEAARAEAARAEAARGEAARAEAARAEAARAEAARAEAARAEAARAEAARAEAARAEAARAEAARAEAARAEAARAEAARAEAARAEAAQEAAARREAALRAIGRQLDEEAARRDAATAARASPSQLPLSSGARRYRLFGRSDPNAELILYAEAWARKIQMNMTFDIVREAVKRPHADPLVTVAIRSDGSVESVTFVQSSGVAALDEAIRRVVDSQKPYQPFPPGLAREFDVIEIRRTWYFDMAIRLY